MQSREKTWIVWGVGSVVPAEKCNSLRAAMRSPIPGIVHECDVVVGDDDQCETFLHIHVIGVNDKLRAELH